MAQMRGYFPFPPTSPQTNGVPSCVILPAGGIYIIPAGEYLVIPGQQTVLEFFDPLALTWRATQCYQGQVEQVSSDGANYRLVNLSGVVVGANVTNAGSTGTNGIGPSQTGSTVTFGAPAAGGVTATAQGYVVVGGSVPAPTVAQGGSGFLVPPTIACDPPPAGGVQATFTSTISSAGVITGVTQVNPGAGYTSIPQFYIVPQPMFYQGAPRFPGDAAPAFPPPPGLIHPNNVWNGSPFQANLSSASGALLTGNALTGSGTLTAIVMTYYGNGYTGATIPSITFGGTSLGAAAATAIMSMCANVATLTGNGAGFTVGNAAVSSLGLVASTNINNIFTPRPFRGIISNANGSLTVEDPGFGLQKVPTYGTLFNVTLAAFAASTASTLTSSQIGGASDTSILIGQVQ